MTFLEAAQKILGEVGGPLKSSEITALAIGRRLLTLVGREPEMTMRTQLAKAFAENPGKPFVLIATDIYGLSEYPEIEADPQEEWREKEQGREGQAEKSLEESGDSEDDSEADDVDDIDDTDNVDDSDDPNHLSDDVDVPLPPINLTEERVERGKAAIAQLRERTSGPAASGPGVQSPESQGSAVSGDISKVSEPPRSDAVHHKPVPLERPSAENANPSELLEAAIKVLPKGPGAKSLFDVCRAVIDQDAFQGKPDFLGKLLKGLFASDTRDRLRSGQRPRIIAYSNDCYAAPDVSEDLAALEKYLSDSRRALRTAVVEKLEQRIGTLGRPSFEALCNVLLHKEGFGPSVPVKVVGETTYCEAMRTKGAQEYRTLVAMRFGASEISRRSVGELKAGVKAKGDDEGILLAGGRIGQEARQEWRNPGANLEIIDGVSLAEACLRHGLGVIPSVVSLEFFDEEFFVRLDE